MNATLTLATGMVRSWVAVYTLGLPRELRSSRRWEIDSDVWEQRQLAEMCDEPPLGTAVEMVARTLLGVLSDITWRVQAGMSTRPDRSIKVTDSLSTKAIFLAAVAISIVPAAMGIAAIFGASWGSTVERAIWGSLLVIASAAIVSGLVLSNRRPRLGIALVGLGAIGVAIVWFFIPFITIPLGIALAYLAYRRARKTGWPRRAGTA